MIFAFYPIVIFIILATSKISENFNLIAFKLEVG